MVRIMLVGNVDPQTTAVKQALRYETLVHVDQPDDVLEVAQRTRPDLIVVAGWRHLIPPEVLAIAPAVGFHSAKLPEYPGRAPIYWTLLRGDSHAWNTMLFLTEEPDAGDIIDAESRAIQWYDDPESLYRWVAESDARMLLRHLPALKKGTAPRARQSPARRGPLTTRDGYDRWLASQS